MQINIAIVGIKGVPADYGGFETFVENWMNYTSRQDEFVIYCESIYNKKTIKGKFRRKFISIPANGIFSLFYDSVSMLHACIFERASCIVLLGVSGAWILPLIKALFPSTRIVVNIDGLEWKRAKWSSLQSRALKILEGLAVRHADEIVVDNHALSEYVKLSYEADCVIIPYGHEHCLPITSDEPIKSENYYLSICRIEPENSCELILETFSRNCSKRLIFVGNWGNSDYAKGLYARFSNIHNLELIGPEYNQQVLTNLRSNCTAYVHGHTAGGTNPSLVEILQYNKSIIAHDNEFNRWTLDNRGYFFNDKDSLDEYLTKELKVSEDWSSLLKSRYSWQKIVNDYEEICLDNLKNEKRGQID